MRKSTIKRAIKEVNEKLVRLTLEKTSLIISKPRELNDTESREFDAKVWDIDNHMHQLKGQKRALMNIIGTL